MEISYGFISIYGNRNKNFFTTDDRSLRVNYTLIRTEKCILMSMCTNVIGDWISMNRMINDINKLG